MITLFLVLRHSIQKRSNNSYDERNSLLPFGTSAVDCAAGFTLVQDVDQHGKQNGMDDRLRND